MSRGLDLQGAVVVVTGASSGFGERASLRFARAGSSVVLAARRLERLEALAERIGASGGTALPVRCDVTDLEQLEALRDRVAEAFGRCDVLVNNAGIPGGGAFEDVDLERIERVVQVNLLGVVRGTKVFLPMMLERGRGHVVNIASIAGRFATPGAAVYGATKHGVVAFSESLNITTSRGVLVTAVCPGFAVTEGFPAVDRPRLLTVTPEQVAATIVDVVRKGRAGTVCIPAWAGPFAAFQSLTPGLYRWVMARVSQRYNPPPK